MKQKLTKQDLDRETKREVRLWLEQYKKQVHMRSPLHEQKITSNIHRLYSVELYELQGLTIPEHFQPKTQQLLLHFAVSLFDEAKQRFFSRTYHSQSIHISLNQPIEEEEVRLRQDSSLFQKPDFQNPRMAVSQVIEELDEGEMSPGRNLDINIVAENVSDSIVSVEPPEQIEEPELCTLDDVFWVGFYGLDKLDLLGTSIVVELTVFTQTKTTGTVDHTETLGYTKINLGSYERDFFKSPAELEAQSQAIKVGSVKVPIFSGSPNQGYPIFKGNSSDILKLITKETAGNLVIKLHFERKDADGPLMPLVGLYNLFGQEDEVIGLLEKKVPPDPMEILDLKLDDMLDVYVTDLQITMHKAIETDLLEECNELYPKKYSQFSPTRNQVKDFQVKSVQIVCHNGWKATNSAEYANAYMLRKIETNVQSPYNFLVMSNWQAKVDRCFPDAIIVFQLVYEANILVDVLGRQNMIIYVGWCAVPVNRLYHEKGECHVTLDIMGGCGHSFDRQGYFSKAVNRSPGKLVVKLKFDEKFHQLEHKGDLEVKLMSIEKNKLSKKAQVEYAFKNKLKEKTMQLKIDIKTGKMEDPRQKKQEAVVKEIQQQKQQTQGLAESIIDMEMQLEQRNQHLVKMFREIVQRTDQNLMMVQDKYTQHQHRLYNYQQRKEQLTSIEQAKLELQTKKYDLWMYEGIHPLNLSVYYDIDSFRDFLMESHFGYHDIPEEFTQTLFAQSTGGMLKSTLQNLELYFNSELPQDHANKFEKRMMRIEIELLSYMPQLCFMTDSSKEEFTIPPLNTLENHVPTSLQFIVHVFGQPPISTNHVVYMNGLNRETFSASMSEFKPLILMNKDRTPVKVSLIVPERALHKQYATIEVWNADSRCLMGKFWLPLFSQKHLHREEKISRSVSISNMEKSVSPSPRAPMRMQAKQTFYQRKQNESKEDEVGKGDKEFNERLKSHILPLPVCVSCDVIASCEEYMIGTVQVCAFMSSAGLTNEIQQVEQPQVKATKSKIVSMPATTNRFALRSQITNESSILPVKYQSDIRFSHLMQVSSIKEQQRASYLKQIVDEEHFTSISVIHRVGLIEIVPYALINKRREDCTFLISIEDFNQHKRYGQLTLVTDRTIWERASQRHKYSVPPLTSSDTVAYNVFQERLVIELSSQPFWEIVVPAQSESNILFHYSATAPIEGQALQHASRNLIRMVVRSSLEYNEVVGGLNISIKEEPPVYLDILRLYISTETQIRLHNPILYWINSIKDIKRAMSLVELYSPDYPLRLKYFSIEVIVFDLLSPVAPEQKFEAYLIIYKDKYKLKTRQVHKIIIEGCQHREYLVTQGKSQIVNLPLTFTEPTLVNFKSSKPKEVRVPERFTDGIIPVANIQQSITLELDSYSDRPSSSKLVCITEKQHRTVLIHVRPTPPTISLLYDVDCTRGRKMDHSFIYKNKLDQTLRLTMEASHQQMKISHPSQEFKPFEGKIINCLFMAERLLHKIQIKVFVHDNVSGFYDCILFRVNYS